MIVLQVSHVKKSYDTVDVLHDASLIVREGDRVGLVGGNGAGKSTLMQIVSGVEEADAGQVTWREGVSLGYVSQFIDTDNDLTVYNFVAEARKHLEQMEQELRRLESQMANPAVYEDADRFAQISNTYDEHVRTFTEAGGYAWQTDIRRVLAGLHFPQEMHSQPISSLSGGQKTRLSLARLLASQPTLLLLDEPTNYLDTDTITWLEQFLKGYTGSILVISHDRYFLDEITNQTVELDNGYTTSYPGNYAMYMEQKAQARLQQMKQFAQQQEEIAKLETFVAKNLARASTTKRAQSRRRTLEKMDRIEKPAGDKPRVHLALGAARPSGRDVLLVEDLAVGYANKTLAQSIDFRLERGMRLAILGPNGIGKSTLLKTLLGQLTPLAGQFTFGQHVHIAYYDQEQSDLDESKTVLSHVWDEHPGMDMTTVRGALAQFLFRGNDVEKPVSGLSGGERSRLNLCRMMLKRANTLLMDEPTNHLDIPSKEALEDALLDYDGTLLFISHDRYFIDAIATHVGVLSEIGLTLYIGNYSDYREKLAENLRMAEIEQQQAAAATPPAAQKSIASASMSDAADAQPRRRIRSSDIRKAQESVAHWEQVASECEAALEETNMRLSEAAQAQDVDRIYALDEQRMALETQHQEAFEAWEKASVELEELQRLEQDG